MCISSAQISSRRGRDKGFHVTKCSFIARTVQSDVIFMTGSGGRESVCKWPLVTDQLQNYFEQILKGNQTVSIVVCFCRQYIYRISLRSRLISEHCYSIEFLQMNHICHTCLKF